VLVLIRYDTRMLPPEACDVTTPLVCPLQADPGARSALRRDGPDIRRWLPFRKTTALAVHADVWSLPR
jgi:hypothetical protein